MDTPRDTGSLGPGRPSGTLKACQPAPPGLCICCLLCVEFLSPDICYLPRLQDASSCCHPALHLPSSHRWLVSASSASSVRVVGLSAMRAATTCPSEGRALAYSAELRPRREAQPVLGGQLRMYSLLWTGCLWGPSLTLPGMLAFGHVYMMGQGL